jgi:glycosyltransferase involved in cell wall biosynthesis
VRILFLNWRDIRNPKAGGAEVLTHEVARRLAASHDVTWFTSRAPGHAAKETIDGVSVVRRGSEATTRLYAPRFGRSGHWDVVIEEINTLPYFSHVWSRAPTVLFIPQLAREVWWYEAPKVVAWLGWLSEPAYLAAYRGVRAITISDSTRSDLRRLGLRESIEVLPMAVSTPALDHLSPKHPTGELVSVGRLVPSKRFDHAIEALSKLRERYPSARLTIIGEGPERARLGLLADRLGLHDVVRFAGRVTEEAKVELLGRSDVLVACAVREGWGLTTTEAARVGTPAVTYDVPGLRDSVVDGTTGVLTAQSPVALAEGIRRVLDDRHFYDALRAAAWERSRHVSWNDTARSFERALRSAISSDAETAGTPQRRLRGSAPR